MTMISRSSAPQRPMQIPDAIQKSDNAQPAGVSGIGEATAAKAPTGTPVSAAPTQFTDAKASAAKTQDKGKPQGKDKFKAGLQAAQAREAPAKPEALKTDLQSLKAAPTKIEVHAFKLEGGTLVGALPSDGKRPAVAGIVTKPGDEVSVGYDKGSGEMVVGVHNPETGKDQLTRFQKGADGKYTMQMCDGDPNDPAAWEPKPPVALNSKNLPELHILNQNGQYLDPSGFPGFDTLPGNVARQIKVPSGSGGGQVQATLVGDEMQFAFY